MRVMFRNSELRLRMFWPSIIPCGVLNILFCLFNIMCGVYVTAFCPHIVLCCAWAIQCGCLIIMCSHHLTAFSYHCVQKHITGRWKHTTTNKKARKIYWHMRQLWRSIDERFELKATWPASGEGSCHFCADFVWVPFLDCLSVGDHESRWEVGMFGWVGENLGLKVMAWNVWPLRSRWDKRKCLWGEYKVLDDTFDR